MSVEQSATAGPPMAYVGTWVALGVVSALYIATALHGATPDGPAAVAAGATPTLSSTVTPAPEPPVRTAAAEPEIAPEQERVAAAAPIADAAPATPSPATPPPAAIVTGSLPPAPPVAEPPARRLPKVINLQPEPAPPRVGPKTAGTEPETVPEPASARPVAAPKTIVAPPAEKPAPGQFAVQLGSEGTLDEVRAKWAVSSAQSPDLERLEPRVTATDAFGSRAYRLAAGPLPSRAEAAKICAELRAVGITCRVGGFSGEPIPAR